RDDGAIVGASKIARDISDRKRAEEQADREHRRTAFLAQMADALSTSLDYEKTLKNVAALAVPALADWCAVDVVQEDGEIARLAVAHGDADKIELVREVRRRYEDPTAPHDVAQAIRTATPPRVPEITDDMIVASARGDQERVHLVRSLGLKSYMCVPLVVGGRALGAITLAAAASDRRYSEDDLPFPQD